MLYELHELHHALIEPWHALARTNHELFSHPFSPLSYHPLADRVTASADLMQRLTRRYEKPTFRLNRTVIKGADVAVAERAVLKKPFCTLLHFERAVRRDDPKVLVVAPLSGHFATLLRDTVRSLLPEHDVYLTDWADAKMVPLAEGHFHLDDYVDYVREFIRFLGPEVHVISVCQPTVPVLAAVSLMAAADEPVRPRTMVMMGGPIDARRSPTAVNGLATRKSLVWFERALIQRVPAKYPGFMRRVYPGFLQWLGFVGMNSTRHADAHWDYFHHLVEGDGESAAAHRRFYDEYNATLDLPAEYYLDTIRTVFQEFELPLGRWRVRGELVNPAAISRTALLTIEGELDDISGFGQTEAAHALCVNVPARRREHYLVPNVGHYGIFSGRKWRETIAPRVGKFIRRHA
jgi:poly(3-hydroxybutyrate) depolymerase